MDLGHIALNVGQQRSGTTKKVADIIEFVESRWGLNTPLFPVQRVILKATYGIPLDNTEMFKVSVDWHCQKFVEYTEQTYLEHLFKEGRCNIKKVVPGEERRELVLSVGRRSGKTLLAACIAAYEIYKLILKGSPQKYYGLPKGDQIGVVSVATDKDQAGLLFHGVSGYVRECGFFAPYTANNTQTYAKFQTPQDIKDSCRYSDDPKMARTTIRASFRSCVAKGLRGPGNIVIILDELAHFTDGNQQSSAKAVYDAVTPSRSAFSPKDPC
jgi:hypothetical protein